MRLSPQELLPHANNLSDIMTKEIPKSEFVTHTDFIFWRPDFHFHKRNKFANQKRKLMLKSLVCLRGGVLGSNAYYVVRNLSVKEEC